MFYVGLSVLPETIILGYSFPRSLFLSCKLEKTIPNLETYRHDLCPVVKKSSPLKKTATRSRYLESIEPCWCGVILFSRSRRAGRPPGERGSARRHGGPGDGAERGRRRFADCAATHHRKRQSSQPGLGAGSAQRAPRPRAAARSYTVQSGAAK